MKKNSKAVIKVGVSLALFSIILLQMDLAAVWLTIRSLNSSYIPLVIGLLIANYIISSVRWKKLLIFENYKTIGVPYLTKLYFIGAFFNNFMPTSIGGDVYKVFRLGKKHGDNAGAFTATFMERFTGIIALVLICYYGFFRSLSFWLTLLPTSITSNKLLVVTAEAILFLGFWVGSGLAYLMLRTLAFRKTKVKKLYDSFLLYKSRYRVIVWALITSFIVQFLSILTQYFIFIALGIELPINYAFFTFPLITMASFFIPSLNGVGVQDTLYIQLFAPVGVNSELALSASIIYHLFRLLVSLFGGIMYAFDRDN